MYEWVEFRHFRYLLTILERQGFRIAAEELHTSQPNLTVQARQFQENIPVRLFRKMKNGRIRPTEAGIAFIPLARYLLETRDEVIDALIAIERGEISSARFGSSTWVDPVLFRSLLSIHREIMPSCAIRPTHGDTTQLAEEVAHGAVDAALVTLPLKHPELQIEELCRDRLVVCLRKDNPLAGKAALQPTDLDGNLAVFYHPQRDPAAHGRLLELLAAAGVKAEGYSRASNPSEMLMLVKEGYGITLIREGAILDEELTTRPIAGVDWTVGTAVIYHRQRHPKTIPILVKQLRKQLAKNAPATAQDMVSAVVKAATRVQKRPPQPETNEHLPVQLRLLG